MTPTADPVLLQRARHFEQDALAEIFDCYHAGIFRYALRFLGDSDLVSECMSETFSRFLQALQQGGGPDQAVLLTQPQRCNLAGLGQAASPK